MTPEKRVLELLKGIRILSIENNHINPRIRRTVNAPTRIFLGKDKNNPMFVIILEGDVCEESGFYCYGDWSIEETIRKEYNMYQPKLHNIVYETTKKYLNL